MIIPQFSQHLSNYPICLHFQTLEAEIIHYFSLKGPSLPTTHFPPTKILPILTLHNHWHTEEVLLPVHLLKLPAYLSPTWGCDSFSYLCLCLSYLLNFKFLESKDLFLFYPSHLTLVYMRQLFSEFTKILVNKIGRMLIHECCSLS